MASDHSIFELIGAATGGAVTAVGGMYRLFVPRGEAYEYRKGADEHRALLLQRINSVEETLSKEVRSHRESVDEHRAFLLKRLDSVESALSKAITRDNLNDVIEPVKNDLREIKQLLREKK